MEKSIAMIFLSMAMAATVNSEVIKCKLALGKIVYQPTPCSSAAVSQQKVEIKKMDPQQVEEAQSKLKAWQAEQAANEAAKIKAAKELQEELDRQETINALNRNAIAQQQQAIAAQRQAEALERRNNAFIYNSPPYYGYGTQFYTPQFYGIPFDPHHSHEHHERHRHDANEGPHGNSGANRPTYPQGQRYNRGILSTDHN